MSSSSDSEHEYQVQSEKDIKPDEITYDKQQEFLYKMW